MPSNGLRALICLSCALVVLCGCHRDRHTLEVDGLRRSYRLFVPPDAAAAARPLLLVLHPFTGTGGSMRRTTGFDNIAAEAGILVAYPDGLRRRWNAGEGGEVDDTKFLLALVDRISREYRVDPARIYVTGASAGGIMAQYLAANSDRIAAFASVMASLPAALSEDLAPVAATPALFIHGTDDPIIPYDGGLTPSGPGRTTNFLPVEQNAAWWAERNGCGAPPVETIGAPVAGVDTLVFACPEAAPVVLHRVIGGGHTWPGGSIFYPQFITGPVSSTFDASSRIWQFFQEQAQPRAKAEQHAPGDHAPGTTRSQ